MVMHNGPVIRAPAWYNNGTRYLSTVDQGFNLLDDQKLELGTDQDVVVLLRSALLAVDAEVTGVIVGTSAHPAVAASSLIIGNITQDGDIMLVVNDGGNSRGLLKLDADVARILISDAVDAPVPDTLLHIWAADAGATAAANTLLTLEGGGSVNLSFLSPDDSAPAILFGDNADADTGRLRYDHDSDEMVIFTAGTTRMKVSAAEVDLATAGMDLDLNAAFIQLSEMSAPGAGAANHVRIYAEDDGGGLTDLSAVFQDGTVVDFAEEV